MRLSLSILSTLFLIHSLKATLLFTNGTIAYDVPIYQGLGWNQEMNKHLKERKQVYILPLNNAFGDYNPCDESTYKPESISSFLDEAGISKITDVIGYVESPKIQKLCKLGHQVLNWDYTHYIAFNTQSLGLHNVIMHISKYYNIYKIIPPNVNVNEKKVKGTEITVSSFMSTLPLPESLTIGINNNFTLQEASYDVNPFEGIIIDYICFRCNVYSLCFLMCIYEHNYHISIIVFIS